MLLAGHKNIQGLLAHEFLGECEIFFPRIAASKSRQKVETRFASIWKWKEFILLKELAHFHLPHSLGKKQKGKLSTTGHPATLQSCRNSNWSHCYNPAGTEAETRFNSIGGDRDEVNGANLTEMIWQGKEVTGNSWWIRNSGTVRSFSTFQMWKTKNGVFFSDKIWAENEKAHLLRWQG